MGPPQVLLDPPLPGEPPLFSSEAELAAEIAMHELRGVPPAQQRLLTLARRVRLDPTTIPANHLNQEFSRLLHELHAALAFKVRAGGRRAGRATCDGAGGANARIVRDGWNSRAYGSGGAGARIAGDG